jgi:hypothetical protein
MKSAVEQLDTLVAAFDDATRYIEPSAWPEIQAKAELKAFFDSQLSSGAIPVELAPKDWSRFVDNVYGAVAAGRDRAKPAEIGLWIRRDFEAEVAHLGRNAIPLSISLWQLAFASLVKSGTISTTLRKHWPLITPELEALYPSVRAVHPRFDYT